ncbi:DNA polymerase III subunit chi [uncultured Cohaesibacter sp.]|uniref:DNA polymerase III subunit chi n=2 Tax=uncultured Cohaesibacter sp. TaxID=1002546 RepID=UPI0037490464
MMPAEIFFYHLQMQPLEATLPVLLEKCLEKGWHAFVQTGSEERAQALDTHLWTWREDSFLAHGLEGSAHAEKQPILIASKGIAAGNDAQVRFFVDGARPEENLALLDGLERVILMFDGSNGEALQAARASWKRLKEAGHPVTYWQQTSRGGWEKKA